MIDSEMRSLTEASLRKATEILASAHPEFTRVVDDYGPPPLWDREPGFATLLQIVLGQQVSLASAKACFDKLAARLGDISPASVLTLNDAEFRTVGFSRQKAGYARHLSEALLEKLLDLVSLHELPAAEVNAELI